MVVCMYGYCSGGKWGDRGSSDIHSVKDSGGVVVVGMYGYCSGGKWGDSGSMVLIDGV